ncbi:hypothetical protein [Kitasatospora griseola]
MSRYVITAEPEAEANWWARNKAFACAVGGLAAGIWLMGGCGSDATTPVTPASSSSSTPAPTAAG